MTTENKLTWQDERIESMTRGQLIEAIGELQNALVKGLDLRALGRMSREDALQHCHRMLESVPEGAVFRGELRVTWMNEEGDTTMELVFDSRAS